MRVEAWEHNSQQPSYRVFPLYQGNKSFFVAPQDKLEEANRAKLAFATGKSDHLTHAKAFAAWQEAASAGRRAEQEFCESNFMSRTTLREVAELRLQVGGAWRHLVEEGFTLTRFNTPSSTTCCKSLGLHRRAERTRATQCERACAGFWGLRRFAFRAHDNFPTYPPAPRSSTSTLTRRRLSRPRFVRVCTPMLCASCYPWPRLPRWHEERERDPGDGVIKIILHLNFLRPGRSWHGQERPRV